MRILTWLFILLLLLASGCSPSHAEPHSVISAAEYDEIIPGHTSYYDYANFAANTQFSTRQEAAMFLANVFHETEGRILEEEPERRSAYCDPGRPYGCPAGADEYFGRGPVQLTWNWNYKRAGDALGLDLLNDPGLVARDPTVGWRTAAWFWTQVPRDPSFGDVIRTINGPLECNGKNPAVVQMRVDTYLRITKVLGVEPGDNLNC